MGRSLRAALTSMVAPCAFRVAATRRSPGTSTVRTIIAAVAQAEGAARLGLDDRHGGRGQLGHVRLGVRHDGVDDRDSRGGRWHAERIDLEGLGELRRLHPRRP